MDRRSELGRMVDARKQEIAWRESLRDQRRATERGQEERRIRAEAFEREERDRREAERRRRLQPLQDELYYDVADVLEACRTRLRKFPPDAQARLFGPRGWRVKSEYRTTGGEREYPHGDPDHFGSRSRVSHSATALVLRQDATLGWGEASDSNTRLVPYWAWVVGGLEHYAVGRALEAPALEVEDRDDLQRVRGMLTTFIVKNKLVLPEYE